MHGIRKDEDIVQTKVNCGHYPIPFFPGYSRIRPPAQNEEENAKEYELSQKQRALERKLRNEKRDLAVLKAQGASEEEIAAQRERVRAADAKLDDFSSATGRARRKSREYTPIKPTFPDKDTYDPKLFDNSQKEEIQSFFRNSGSTASAAVSESSIVEVSTDISQFKSAAVGATNKVEFWMNLTEEQQAAFKTTGMSIDELFNMVKEDSPVSEWKLPNPGGTEKFAIKHNFLEHKAEIKEITARSDGWMASANELGVINVRKGGLGDQWDFIISHEAGHQLSNASPELQRVIMDNPGNILGRYNTRLMHFDGVYGEYNPEEAFATAVSVFVRQPEAMQTRYPDTYEAIKTLFDTSPSAREYVDAIREAYRKKFGL